MITAPLFPVTPYDQIYHSTFSGGHCQKPRCFVRKFPSVSDCTAHRRCPRTISLTEFNLFRALVSAVRRTKRRKTMNSLAGNSRNRLKNCGQNSPSQRMTRRTVSGTVSRDGTRQSPAVESLQRSRLDLDPGSQGLVKSDSTDNASRQSEKLLCGAGAFGGKRKRLPGSVGPFFSDSLHGKLSRNTVLSNEANPANRTQFVRGHGDVTVSESRIDE